MSICHIILLLFEKKRSLGLNIESQTNDPKGVAIGEKSNPVVVGCMFSETKETLTCTKAKDIIEN